MARIYVLRHAKTEFASSSGADFDRRLTDRGIRNGRQIGQYIARHLAIPDCVVTSPAARCLETTELVVAQSPAFPEPVKDGRIYEAGLESLLNILAEHGKGVERLLLVGHNPGMIMLTHSLTAEDGNIAARNIADFPTATLAELVIAGDDVASAAVGEARLVSFLRPRDLGFNR